MQHLIQICGEKSLHIHGQHKNTPEHIETVCMNMKNTLEQSSSSRTTTRILLLTKTEKANLFINIY